MSVARSGFAGERPTIVDGGSEVGGAPPEDFALFLRADRERWKKAVEDAKIAPE
ncbi:MAG: hypothetical protein M3R58_05310 [Pseudomonadota bacterium]|nr:hypothetical protein [Pseudomonadota bacterium]